MRTVLVTAATVAFGFLTLVAVCAADESSVPPNIVVILIDDLGWMDLGCQGSTYYRTPQVDRLAASGVRFTSGYTRSTSAIERPPYVACAGSQCTDAPPRRTRRSGVACPGRMQRR